MKTRTLSVFTGLLFALLCANFAMVLGQEGGPTLQLKPAVFKPRPTPTIVRDSKETEPSFELKYKLAAGLTYPSEVTQRLSVQTTISGVKEDTVTNSVSGKSWRIENAETAGNIRLIHQVDSVRMSQKMTGHQEVTYNSVSDSEIPNEYSSLEGTVGVPLTMVEMNPFGRISKREDLKPQSNPGIGDLTLSLPEEPIRVGDSWLVPDEVSVKVGAAPLLINLRHSYSLVNVSAGLATISYRTEILTPIAADPKVMSQLVSRMQKGEIKFDIDEGRPISRHSEIEQDIIGFAGENSSMRYDMRATEEFGEGAAIVAALPEPAPIGPTLPGAPTAGSSSEIKAPTKPSGKLLPGLSTGSEKETPSPTPATPPPAQGTPTPAPPQGKVTNLAPEAENMEHSVLVTQKSLLAP